jgi:tight adherence protein B
MLIWRVFTSPAAPATPRRRFRLFAWLDELTRSAGLSAVTSAGVGSLCATSFALVGIVVMGVSRAAPVALAFAILAAYGPIALLRGRARRRRRELAEIWPEAVDHLTSAVRAGLSLPEGLAQLGERGPTPLRPAFADFARDYMVTGRFGSCLDRLKASLADPAGDRVVEALRIAREVGGGDLGRMLRTLSRFLRDDARTRAELESRQAWVVNGARLAAAAPWTVLLVLSFQPEVIARYQSPPGAVVIGVGAAVCVLAYRLMIRLGRLPEERRVLA